MPANQSALPAHRCSIHSLLFHAQATPSCASSWASSTLITPATAFSFAGDALLRQKLGLLNFSSAAGWDPTEMLPVYLAAACDPNEQVRTRGAEARVSAAEMLLLNRKLPFLCGC